jgi:NAD(P)-dependent dehydrogenase (short-subunit alcohol dehydrogenase family)
MSNVVVSGANGGFGLLTVRKFAEAGHTVHAGFRSKDRAGDLDALALEFPKLCPVQLDVTTGPSLIGRFLHFRAMRTPWAAGQRYIGPFSWISDSPDGRVRRVAPART